MSTKIYTKGLFFYPSSICLYLFKIYVRNKYIKKISLLTKLCFVRFTSISAFIKFCFSPNTSTVMIMNFRVRRYLVSTTFWLSKRAYHNFLLVFFPAVYRQILPPRSLVGCSIVASLFAKTVAAIATKAVNLKIFEKSILKKYKEEKNKMIKMRRDECSPLLS